MKLINLFLLLYILSLQSLIAQNYPKDYFRSPIDSPIYLSGNFCTLRNDHFHYGIDITTYEKEGMPVYAAADGYVSRVKVSPFGYGKALYIDHPNGYTTVYGHLNRYNEYIAQAVKDTQYKKESFETEFFPAPGSWKVKKGDLIAYSGNSGGSSGPHIHFEVRDTKTEEIINPLLFGFQVLDTIAPEIRQIQLYRFNSGKATPYISISDTINNDTILIHSGTWGIAAIMNDYTTFKAIKFNPYQITLTCNGNKIYNCEYERFSFEQSKMVNCHIDYNTFWNTGARYQQLWAIDGNELTFYNKSKENGYIQIEENKLYQIEILAVDIAGLRTQKTIYFQGIPDTIIHPISAKLKIVDYTLLPKKKLNIDEDIFYIHTELQSIFDTLQISRQLFGCNDCGKVRITTDQDDQPFYKGIEIGLKKPSKLLASDEKLLLGYQSERGKILAVGGSYKDGWISAKIMRPGIYLVIADQTPPLIKPTNINKKNMVKGNFINFDIKDGLSGIYSYRGTLDDQWILMDYDAKNDWLTYIFDENTPKGKHLLQLVVTDKKGNKAVWKKMITIH